jgi:hypothetical protein
MKAAAIRSVEIGFTISAHGDQTAERLSSGLRI